MSLSSKTELARALFRSTPPDSVTRISGTATADSSDGTVTVQLEDGDVIEVGTIGSVSAGDTVTIHVQRGEAQVIASEGWGDAMQAAVDEAQAIAEATGQHFWHDTNGAHVTEVTQDQWAQSQTGHNILVNSLGILLRRALNYLAAWTGSALAFYDGNGNAAANVTAMFGPAGAQIGRAGGSRVLQDSTSWRMVDGNDEVYALIADSNPDGTVVIVEGFRPYDSYVDAAVTLRFTPTELVSVVDTSTDEDITADCTLTGKVVDYSAYGSINPGLISVAYKTNDPMPGYMFGYGCTPSGAASLAGGTGSTASGLGALAFGEGAVAAHKNSVAFGEGTHSTGIDSVALGAYNVYEEAELNTVDPLLVIGNGGAGGRSNIVEVDNAGVWINGGDLNGVYELNCDHIAFDDGTTTRYFGDMFTCATKTATIGAVAANGGTKQLTIDASRSGWKPIAVSGWYLNGAATLQIYRIVVTGSYSQIGIYLRNPGSSATSSSATIEVQVLYVRDEMSY